MSIFGQTPTSGPQLFGSTTLLQTGGSTPGTFGVSSALEKPKAVFGQTSANAPSTGTGGAVFGQTGTNQSNTGGLGNTSAAQPSSNIFGNSTTAQASTSLFGNANTQASTGGFGNTSTTGAFGNANPAQPSTGLFGSTPAQPSTSLFGNTNNQTSTGAFGNTATQPSTSIFGSNTAQPSSSIFGTSTAAQPSGGLFGQTQSNNVFGQTSNNAFGQTTQNQQQPQGRPLDQTLRFGLSESQMSVAQARDSQQAWWQEGRGLGVYRSIPDQMGLIKDKWDVASAASPLRTYLYQHVNSETEALKYRPGPGEDEQKWEEAVQKRPGGAWVPLLVRGFFEMGKKAQLQMEEVQKCNMMLNEINTSLDIQLDAHRQKVAARLAAAKRRHLVISQRTLALAVKVQTLKNRGYVMDNAEEELKAKLMALEKDVFDPSLGAREQEIWARMLGIRERARRLKQEMDNLQPNGETEKEEPLLDEDTVKAAKHTLEAYDTQLQHLQKELRLVQHEYAEWEKFAHGGGDGGRRSQR